MPGTQGSTASDRAAGRPLSVAVVGSGPAGIYAVDTLTDPGGTGTRPVRVDVIDLLPSPYGLVRYGVAPDHPKIKSVERTLQRVLERPNVTFIGNVCYGRDVSMAELRERYDAVLISTGSPHDRRLGVPGEDLPGSHAAADLVAWYSGHPGYPPDFPLGARSVAVIGAGNVALDVARVLLKGADALTDTDVPQRVLDTLSANPVDDVHIIARRGPAQIKFTLVELREMGALPGTDVLVDPAELVLDAASEQAVADKRSLRTMVELLEEWSRRPVTGAPRRLHIRFLRSPAEILGDESVRTLVLERGELDGTGRARGTGELEKLPVDMVVRAIGYRGAPLPDLPLDDATGTVRNDEGRVLDPTGAVRAGVYVAGWIKRGPTGVIGTNKSDGRQSARAMLDDAAAGRLPAPPYPQPTALTEMLAARGVGYVTWQGWQAIDAFERELGVGRATTRVKTPDLAAMLRRCRPGAEPDA